MTGVDNGSRERKLTRTMFCVVILSILYSTYFLIRILLATNCIGEKTFFILRPIYSLLFVINSSANLFIYLYFNNKFQGSFVTIFSCNKRNQNVLNGSRLPIVLKTTTNNKDAIKKTAVFYQNANEEVLELL